MTHCMTTARHPQSPLSFLLVDSHKEMYPHQLVARFPHVAKRIAELWNDADAVSDYFTDLMIPSRSNRQGFPPAVAVEIMALSMAHDKTGPVRARIENPLPGSGVKPYLWENEPARRELEELGIPLTAASLARAAEAGDHARCVLFLRAGLDVEARDSRQWTPLMIAAFHGRESLAYELIECGASIHARDAGGYTPLHWAAYNGYHRVVRLLLSKGASANVSSKAGITPLLQAAARGHGDVIAELLSKRADPNLIANDGSSPLLKAIANGHSAVVRVLVDAGASINVTMKDGTTLFEIAQRSKDPTIRRVALARYAPSTFEWPKSVSVATIGLRMRNPTPALTV